MTPSIQKIQFQMADVLMLQQKSKGQFCAGLSLRQIYATIPLSECSRNRNDYYQIPYNRLLLQLTT